MALCFLALSIDLKPPYKNSYIEGTFFSKSTEARLFNYLTSMKAKGGVWSSNEGWSYIMAWEEDGLLHYPNAPYNWKQSLLTRNDKIVRNIANIFSIIYIFILFSILSYDHGDDYLLILYWRLENIAPFYFLIGLLPPFIYFYRRFNKDRLTQGYLDGYVDGYSQACVESIEKHNIEINKMVSLIESQNNQTHK